MTSSHLGRSNETAGGAEETGGAPQPGAGETEADRDEVCFPLKVTLYTARAPIPVNVANVLSSVEHLRSVLISHLIAVFVPNLGMKKRGGGEKKRC